MDDAAQTDPGEAAQADAQGFANEFEAIVDIIVHKKPGPGVEVVFLDSNSRQRIADYAFILSRIVKADSKPFYSLIRVLLPPDALSERRDAFMERLVATPARRLPEGVAGPDRAAIEQIFSVVELRDFTVSTLLGEIAQAPKGAAIVPSSRPVPLSAELFLRFVCEPSKWPVHAHPVQMPASRLGRR